MKHLPRIHRIPSIPFIDVGASKGPRQAVYAKQLHRDWSSAPSGAVRRAVRVIFHWSDTAAIWRKHRLDELSSLFVLAFVNKEWAVAQIKSARVAAPGVVDITVQTQGIQSPTTSIRIRSGTAYFFIGARTRILMELCTDLTRVPVKLASFG
jgi:hypothetical protein